MGVEFSFLIFWPVPRGVGASILAETALMCSFVYMLLGLLTLLGSSISDIMSKILISTLLLLFLFYAIRFYFSAKTGRRSL